VVQLDLLERDRIKPAVDEAAAALGGIDILVNNAAGFYRGGLMEFPENLLEENFIIKPIGLMRMARECLPYLEKSDPGHVINLSGTRGREPSLHSTMSGPINIGNEQRYQSINQFVWAERYNSECDLPGLDRYRALG
jgi:NAD(P)-dependent dehydrogenase (short-subunit alcohol dehydrogenase family)